MKTYLARQPILNKDKDIISYELLFRSGENNEAHVMDGYKATLKVIKDLIINFGFDEIAGGRRVFINFNEALILDRAPDLFQPNAIVIELLEETVDGDDILKILYEYKDYGYTIALDDFEFSDDKVHLCQLADIIKLDFMISTRDELKEYVERLKPFNVVLLAEKIETEDDYQFAIELGCSYFQGYYFYKPTILESSEQSVLPNVYFELIEELNKDEVNFRRLENIVKRDNHLVVSLLKLLNSAAYYSRSEVTTIRHALVRLGVKGSKGLFITNMLKDLGHSGVPTALIMESLIRGKTAELLAEPLKLGGHEDELFLVGILSKMDIIFQREMDEVIKDLPLHVTIKEALLGEANDYHHALAIIEAHESDKVDVFVELLERHQIDMLTFSSIYMKANIWCDSIWGAM